MAAARREVYSFSRLSAFRDCPRRYEFRYVRRLPPAFRSVETALGRAVHQALEWLYAEEAEGRRATCAALLGRFDRCWERELGPDVRLIRAQDSFERHHARGRELLTRFHGGIFEQDRTETIALERRFEIELRGRYRFMGFIDRVARDPDGALHLFDYKTTGRPPQELTREDALQLRGYGLAELGSAERIRLSFVYLQDGRSLGEEFDAEAASAVEADLADRIERVRAAREFPPSPSALCAWCGYREQCDASGFGENAAGRERTCPRCGDALRLRNGRHGPFWGCASFPDCRYTRDAAGAPPSR